MWPTTLIKEAIKFLLIQWFDNNDKIMTMTNEDFSYITVNYSFETTNMTKYDIFFTLENSKSYLFIITCI